MMNFFTLWEPRKGVGGLDKLVHPNGSNLQFKNIWLEG